MARSFQVQTAFNAGELDPLMKGRADLKAYTTGCETLSNWSLLAQGGIRRRPGTKYVGTAYDGRLASFEFSDGQEYVFCFSDARLDMWAIDGTVCTALTSCPWSTSQLFDLTWTQSGDTMIVCHKDMVIQKIVRTGATTFTRAAMDFDEHSSGWPKYRPWYKYANTSVTLTPSSTTGSITLTSSAAHFVSGHVGLIVRHKDKQIEITAYTNSTTVTGTVRETLTDTTATTDWDEEAFSTVQGYPAACVFHQDRLYFAGAKNKLTGVWGSKSGQYFNFDLGSAADADGFAYSLLSDQVAEIRHLVSHRHLQIFTAQAEFFVPSSAEKPITPTNFMVKKQTPYGCSNLRPQTLDGATLFMQKTKKALREFLFDYLQDSYDSNAVSLVATHLLTGPRDMAAMYGTADRPEQYAFIVNDDGTMAVYHSVRAEKLAGWVPWSTNGLFRSVCESGNKVFVLVKRTINNSTVYYVEQFDSSLTLDCAKISTGSASVTWGSLNHLNGNSVHVVSGNYYLGTKTVTTNAITLDDEVTTVQVGLDYTPDCKTLPPIVQSQAGPIIMRQRRIAKIFLLIDSTLSMTVNGTELIVRQVTDDLSEQPEALTQAVEFFVAGYSKSPYVRLTQTIPLGLTILALSLEVVY
jgi:hypothetical protein